MMTLPAVMRVLAVLIVCMVTAEYFVLGELLVPPFAVVATLLALSFGYQSYPVPVTWIALFMSVVVPVAAAYGYLQGQLMLVVPIFDTIIFSWLLGTALRVLRVSRNSHL